VSIVITREALRARLEDGGKVFGAFIVARTVSRTLDNIEVHLSCDWLREPGCRTALVLPEPGRAGDFTSLDEAWSFIQSAGYGGVIPIYPVSAYDAPDRPDAPAQLAEHAVPV
jgi:hypothetical protein